MERVCTLPGREQDQSNLVVQNSLRSSSNGLVEMASTAGTGTQPRKSYSRRYASTEMPAELNLPHVSQSCLGLPPALMTVV